MKKMITTLICSQLVHLCHFLKLIYSTLCIELLQGSVSCQLYTISIHSLRKAFDWKWTLITSHRKISQSCTLFNFRREVNIKQSESLLLSVEDLLHVRPEYSSQKPINLFKTRYSALISRKERITIFQPLALQFNPAIISAADIRSEEKIHYCIQYLVSKSSANYRLAVML